MKYAVKITAHIEAKDENEAKAVAKKVDEALRNRMAKIYFDGQGIKLVGHAVDPSPEKL